LGEEEVGWLCREGGWGRWGNGISGNNCKLRLVHPKSLGYCPGLRRIENALRLIGLIRIKIVLEYSH
jgi:hypothetical protein